MRDKNKHKKASHQSYLRNKTVIRARNLRDKKRKREYIQKLKSVPCMDCKNSFNPVAMDFDHREGSDKKMNVSMLCNYSWDRLLKEIEKCDIICSNCHRIRHYYRKLL